MASSRASVRQTPAFIRDTRFFGGEKTRADTVKGVNAVALCASDAARDTIYVHESVVSHTSVESDILLCAPCSSVIRIGVPRVISPEVTLSTLEES